MYYPKKYFFTIVNKSLLSFKTMVLRNFDLLWKKRWYYTVVLLREKANGTYNIGLCTTIAIEL